MSNKKSKKKRAESNQEDLPSFLTKLTAFPEEIELPAKTTKSDVYLGSIFFGVCKSYHPPLHSLQLTRYNLIQHIAPSRENFFDNLLLPTTPPVKKNIESPEFRIRIPRKKKLFDDPYPHKSPGTKKTFTQEVSLRSIDLGETTCKIMGETCQEIRFCRLSSISSRTSLNNMEMVTLSDIREKNRMYMSSQERAAHSHFPKEFTTLQVHGPKIPASILITAIPSKRKKPSDYKYKLLSQTEKKKDSEQKPDQPPATPKSISDKSLIPKNSSRSIQSVQVIDVAYPAVSTSEHQASDHHLQEASEEDVLEKSQESFATEVKYEVKEASQEEREQDGVLLNLDDEGLLKESDHFVLEETTEDEEEAQQ